MDKPQGPDQGPLNKWSGSSADQTKTAQQTTRTTGAYL